MTQLAHDSMTSHEWPSVELLQAYNFRFVVQLFAQNSHK